METLPSCWKDSSPSPYCHLVCALVSISMEVRSCQRRLLVLWLSFSCLHFCWVTYSTIKTGCKSEETPAGETLCHPRSVCSEQLPRCTDLATLDVTHVHHRITNRRIPAINPRLNDHVPKRRGA